MMRTLLLLAILMSTLSVGGAVASSADGGDRLVDVGGHRLRVRQQGSGSPVVVLEAGGGESLDTWRALPDLVSELTTVVAYDRAGLGESDLGPEPRDARAVATDLDALLAALALDPPYLLVGHSLGGLYVRVFADRHPGEIAGLVLLDATTEGMFESLKTEEGRAEVMRQLASESEGVKAEARGNPASLEQIAALSKQPDAPVVVITSMAPIEIPEEYREQAAAAGMTEERLRALQQRKFQHHAHLVAKLPQAEHLVAERSHHFVHHDEPELVIGEIERLVAMIRSGSSAGQP